MPIGQGSGACSAIAAKLALGLEGQVTVQRDGGTVWIGGHVTTCVRGEVLL